MKAKTLKSSQILRAHMPYFRRPGHIYSTTVLYDNNNLDMYKVADNIKGFLETKPHGELLLP